MYVCMHACMYVCMKYQHFSPLWVDPHLDTQSAPIIIFIRCYNLVFEFLGRLFLCGIMEALPSCSFEAECQGLHLLIVKTNWVQHASTD